MDEKIVTVVKFVQLTFQKIQIKNFAYLKSQLNEI